MKSYPFTLLKEEDSEGYLVTFRDIPEAITQGKTKKEACVMAEDAIRTALEFYFEDFRLVPEPSSPESGEYISTLPFSYEVRILLLNTLISKGFNINSLAHLMDVSIEHTSDLFDLNTKLDLDLLTKAFNSFGFNLDLSLVSK